MISMIQFMRSLIYCLILGLLGLPGWGVAQPSADILEYGLDFAQAPNVPVVVQTSPRTIELLGQALRDSDYPPRQIELLDSLAMTGDPQAAPHLIAAMRDDSPLVRAQAASAARAVADASLVVPLRNLLTDQDVAVRTEAARALARLVDQTGVTTALADSEVSVFLAAATGARTEAQFQTIVARLPSLDVPARARALRALTMPEARAHAAAVAAYLTDPLMVQIAAVEALAGMKAEDHLSDVERLLDHPHPTLRRTVTIALGDLATPERQQALAIGLLGDTDPTVRAHAAMLLEAHPTEAGIAPLAGVLADEYPAVHDNALRALLAAGRAGVVGTIDAAAALLDHADPRRREDGSYLLGRLRSDANLQQHIALLKDPDWSVVAQAAESLGRIGRPEAAPAIGQLTARAGRFMAEYAKSPDFASISRAGEQAFVAAGRLGHRASLDHALPLIPQKTTQPPNLRAGAVWSIGMLAEPSDEATISQLQRLATTEDMQESYEVRAEAAKALGNLRHKGSLTALRKLASDHRGASLGWAAHVAADRIEGIQTPYEPPPIIQSPATVIMDLPSR